MNSSKLRKVSFHMCFNWCFSFQQQQHNSTFSHMFTYLNVPPFCPMINLETLFFLDKIGTRSTGCITWYKCWFLWPFHKGHYLNLSWTSLILAASFTYCWHFSGVCLQSVVYWGLSDDKITALRGQEKLKTNHNM